jgi:hypothetical protein
MVSRYPVDVLSASPSIYDILAQSAQTGISTIHVPDYVESIYPIDVGSKTSYQYDVIYRGVLLSTAGILVFQSIGSQYNIWDALLSTIGTEIGLSSVLPDDDVILSEFLLEIDLISTLPDIEELESEFDTVIYLISELSEK